MQRKSVSVTGKLQLIFGAGTGYEIKVCAGNESTSIKFSSDRVWTGRYRDWNTPPFSARHDSLAID